MTFSALFCMIQKESQFLCQTRTQIHSDILFMPPSLNPFLPFSVYRELLFVSLEETWGFSWKEGFTLNKKGKNKGTCKSVGMQTRGCKQGEDNIASPCNLDIASLCLVFRRRKKDEVRPHQTRRNNNGREVLLKRGSTLKVLRFFACILDILEHHCVVQFMSHDESVSQTLSIESTCNCRCAESSSQTRISSLQECVSSAAVSLEF